MLVRDVMHSPVTTIEAGAKLGEASRLFDALGFRHLPVVEDGRLVGILTDRDLRWVTCSMCPEPLSLEDPVRSAMTHPPLTTDPMDPVEDAAHTMRERKIGCLPVLDGPDLVGILTGMDLLDTLILLTGSHQPSSRLEIAMVDRPGEMAKLTALLADRNMNIHSILSYSVPDQPSRTVVRVGSNQGRILAEELTKAGFQVLWPPAKPWAH